MNPPIHWEGKYISHAFSIAPPGCLIISLCDYNAFKEDKRRYNDNAQELIHDYGSLEHLGEGIRDSNRALRQEIGLVKLRKPGAGYETEFEGFFLFEEEERQENGILPYNLVRDLVNRYVKAIQIYDQQLEAGLRLEETIAGFFETKHAIRVQAVGYPSKRAEFKKDLQKSAWAFIFQKLDLEKIATKGLKEDIYKFIEHQAHIPFTMRNIYRMLQIVAGTTTQRMDKALLEVFDKITRHHAENRYGVEGWHTNSHYLVNKKFILPYLCKQDIRYARNTDAIEINYTGNWDFIEDLVKALCYISGDEYEKFGTLRSWISHPYKTITTDQVYFHTSRESFNGQLAREKQLYEAGIAFTTLNHQPIYGEWFEWAYFRVKAYKKGSMHFEFKDENIWVEFNKRIARLKGFPLYEPKKESSSPKGKKGVSKANY
ncbi:DUF4942 domain-containing protein [Puia dinghuensis]|uniref:DUF4942 domain-containing protein n=1 Tax=Puia dinghuensis TaxID=1792502 RepID=A0A8J2XS61_9BACT|nr:DUF4942 domain-containing protein [Puia dinghuensis]GGA92551.1 hypothetical protein GCM10011511_14910 [Puia dinghuensis]